MIIKRKLLDYFNKFKPGVKFTYKSDIPGISYRVYNEIIIRKRNNNNYRKYYEIKVIKSFQGMSNYVPMYVGIYGFGKNICYYENLKDEIKFLIC